MNGIITKMQRSKCSAVALFFLVAADLSGCRPRNTTPLAADFKSFTREGDILAGLRLRGQYFNWTEHLDSARDKAERSPNQYVNLSGQFVLNGTDGTLTFRFYNDQLMETQFATKTPAKLSAALKEEGLNVPHENGKEVVARGRTRLRFDSRPDGETVFTWVDPVLEEQANSPSTNPQ